MWKIQHSSKIVDTVLSQRAQESFDALMRRKDIGFFNILSLKEGLKTAQTVAQDLRPLYDQICVLGIGGSSLGAQALVEALVPSALETQQILFFDNVDVKSFFRKLSLIKDPTRTLWVLISKSGTTIETLAQAEFIDAWLTSQHKLSLKEHSLVITENKTSPLFDWARKNQVPFLEIPLSVGGRFSALTPVGVFPLLMLGVDAARLIKGAEDVLSKPAIVMQLVGQYTASMERDERTTYFFSYCDDLRYWGQWLQQLWAESLGKKKTSSGTPAPKMSVPVPCRGSADQHSVLQQMSEGSLKKFVSFVRVEASEAVSNAKASSLFKDQPQLGDHGLGDLLRAEAVATQRALNESQVETLTLLGAELSGESVGALMMIYELVVATLGLQWQINPFDQPGVERGKVLAREILGQKI